MSQRYYQELHNTLPPERREWARVPMRQYVNTVKSRTKSIANSYLQEFLDDVFSAEGASRFFKTFLLRFLSDANGSSEDGLRKLLPAYVLATTPRTSPLGRSPF